MVINNLSKRPSFLPLQSYHSCRKTLSHQHDTKPQSPQNQSTTSRTMAIIISTCPPEPEECANPLAVTWKEIVLFLIFGPLFCFLYSSLAFTCGALICGGIDKAGEVYEALERLLSRKEEQKKLAQDLEASNMKPEQEKLLDDNDEADNGEKKEPSYGTMHCN